MWYFIISKKNEGGKKILKDIVDDWNTVNDLLLLACASIWLCTVTINFISIQYDFDLVLVAFGRLFVSECISYILIFVCLCLFFLFLFHWLLSSFRIGSLFLFDSLYVRVNASDCVFGVSVDFVFHSFVSLVDFIRLAFYSFHKFPSGEIADRPKHI